MSKDKPKHAPREAHKEPFHAVKDLVQKKIDIQAMQDQRLAHENGAPWVTILQHFEDNYTVPRMQQIGELLRTKPYLAIDWPQCFDEFLHHESQSIPLYELWRKTGIPGQIETVPWPPRLEDDVKTRKNLLDDQLKALYRIRPPVPKRGIPSKTDQGVGAKLTDRCRCIGIRFVHFATPKLGPLIVLRHTRKQLTLGSARGL